jgi:hypothetical protein
MYFELGVSVANAGGTYEVRCNGSSQDYVPPGTGDTQNGTATTIDQIAIVGGGGPGAAPLFRIDDMYVHYGDELVWLGDARVDPQPLSGDASPQEWTPSTGSAWERLNAGDGYIAANIDEATALFAVSDVAHAPNEVFGVCVRSLLLKESAGTRKAASLLQSGATTVESAELALQTTAQGLTQTLQVDPATGAAWTLNAVNALRAGVRVKV